jgi:Na+/H+ antiporter NhaC
LQRCTFLIHNYVNLNIGLVLTLYEGVTYFIQWVIVGAAIGSWRFRNLVLLFHK